jgi:hypothetical protein
MAGLGLLAACLPGNAEDLAVGPLYHEFRLTLDAGRRVEAFGPFFYDEERAAERFWGIPPVFSYRRNDDIESEGFDFLWKALSYDRFGEEYRIHLLQLLSLGGGTAQADTNAHRFTIFPIYFQQRSPIPEKNYTAVVPVFGRLQNRLFRDEIKFVLFPLYGQSRKKDVVTDNYLFPVLHRRRGEGLSGWQVWPLAGNEHKDITTRTNSWGEVETVGGHDKFFALWPVFFHQHTGIGTEAEARQQVVLPFYSALRSPGRDSTSYLWPIGYTHTEDRARKYEEWGAPWPFIVFARGEGKTTSRVWPLFGRSHNASLTSDWYLWPVYKHNRLKTEAFERERTRLLLFVYSDVRATNAVRAATLRQVDLWPLFTARRDFEGRSRVQVLSLLEPILPNNRGVERNLSPLWSLWRSEKNGSSGATSQSLLWNLYRRDTTPQTRKCSLLFGFFQYQSGPDGKRCRVCFIPVTGPKGADKTASP